MPRPDHFRRQTCNRRRHVLAVPGVPGVPRGFILKTVSRNEEKAVRRPWNGSSRFINRKIPLGTPGTLGTLGTDNYPNLQILSEGRVGCG